MINIENDIPDSTDTTICFTGHRKEKLPFKGDENTEYITALKSMLFETILDHIKLGFDRFIIGGANGIDLWAGEIVMYHKTKYPNIKIILALPTKDHGKNFVGKDKWIFGNLLVKADKIVFVSEKYHRGCMKLRNQYMIDNSSKLIAVISEQKSGTGQTINLANKKGISVHIIDLNRLGEGFDKS